MNKARWTIGFGMAVVTLAGGMASAQPAMDSPTRTTDKADKGSIDAEAKKVLDRAIKATFGDRMNIKSLRTEVSLEMPAQGMRMNVLSEISEGKMSAVVTIPGLGEMRNGYDGKVGWSFSEFTGPAIQEGAELEQTKRQADIYSDVHWDRYFSSVSYAGEEEAENIEGKMVATHVLEFTPKDGSAPERRFFSKETGLLVRMEGIVAGQGGAMVPMATRLGDYREVDGMMVPFLTLAQAGPNQLRSETKKVVVNPEIPASAFELPEEIAEMME